MICQRFSRVTKIVFHGDKCIISITKRYFISWAQNSAQNNHWSLILPFSPRTVLSDLALRRNQSWSVTSREHEVLALCHVRRLFLHAQIGAKAICTCENQPWRSISQHPIFPAERVRNLDCQVKAQSCKMTRLCVNRPNIQEDKNIIKWTYLM